MPLELGIARSDTPYLDRLLSSEHAFGPDRRFTLLCEVPVRSRGLVERLRELYAGRCQLCLWEPTRVYGAELCEAHHLQWLSRGGRDELDNLVLLCPNHHRAVHGCDAYLDYVDLGMVFGVGQRELVRLDRHLLA